MYSNSEQREWEASLDVFQRDQINFMKGTLKGRPGKIGLKGGTGKEMYWVGVVSYRPEYADRSRMSGLLDIESNVDEDILPRKLESLRVARTSWSELVFRVNCLCEIGITILRNYQHCLM